MGRTLAAVLLGLLTALPAAGQPTPSDEDLAILTLLQQVETAISTTDRDAWLALLSTTADRTAATEFFDAIVPHGVTRVVVRERDRSHLLGTLPGEGYRLVAEVFLESGPRGSIMTWRLDIRRPRQSEERQPWRIADQDQLSSIEGLHRLTLDSTRQFAARNLVITSVDFELQMPSGDVFLSETAEGVTGLVLLGDGIMKFEPQPAQERGQVRLFAGSETIDTPFTEAYVRLNPFEFESRLEPEMLAPAGVDTRTLRRARDLFEEHVGKSFALDLSDLSRDTWSLLPQAGDFLAEVNTRRHDTLTYARSGGEAEDVTLFHRERKKNIAVYASEQKLASRGRFYNEDDLVEYDVLDYQVEASFDPGRQWLDGRTRMTLRVKAYALAALTIKLDAALQVRSVVSNEFGRLLALRVSNQNSMVVNLPSPVSRDFELTLTIDYAGRVESQRVDQESIEAQIGRQLQRPEDLPLVMPEPNWLFSNRHAWYPQAGVTDYATGLIRFIVPQEFAVVASGVPVQGSPTLLRPAGNGDGGQVLYAFQAVQPVRYFGVVVSRMTPVDAATVALSVLPEAAPAVEEAGTAAPAVHELAARNTVDLSVVANRRQEGRGRDLVMTAAEILQLYASIVNDVPYAGYTVAMIENDLPGGHSPAYFGVLNNPLPTTPFTWRNDPAAFNNFPEFFLAHEIAHQWWGQAVGWKNYHEQWLSEGFAQYFAALYAREKRGEDTFRDILKQFRRWGMDESDQGPVHLGYRLGHIKNDTRVFRALVYNKSAAVLHMLRLLLGDEVFFQGLRRFYADNRFRKAGTDDFQLAMEQAAERPLGRFFERWIFEAEIPRLRVAASPEREALVVRVEQQQERVYDLPLSVRITYTDGRVEEPVVVVNAKVVEQRLPTSGTVRKVEFNEDHATLADIDTR